MERTGAEDLPERSVAVVLGTRPELIKMAEVLRLLGSGALLIHTGQHFSDELSGYFFGDFGLEPPVANLGVGGASRASQIGRSVGLLDDVLRREGARVVVVQGDTNSTLAGALAANSLELPLLHVEAGLRSFDRRMPEEHNRVVTDHLSDILLAPTRQAEANLAREGIGSDRVRVIGNTVVEAVDGLLPSHDIREHIRHRYGGLPKARYVLATFHRPENVDDPVQLSMILECLASLSLPVVLPLHPRTRSRITEFGFESALERINTIEPLSYRDFLGLAADCALLISDSGGVQEEASVLKKRVLVIRRSTERPEVLGTFAKLIPPTAQLYSAIEEEVSSLPDTHMGLASIPSPYGDGTASRSVVDAVRQVLRNT